MKQYLLTIIAVLAAIILALFSLDTANNQYSTRSYRTYSYNPAPNAWSGTGNGTLSVLQEDNACSTVAPLTEANATTESFLALPEAGSPLVAPPAMLAMNAMTELTPVQLPPLDAGMVNVTGGFDGNGQTAGYRVNPRPGEFSIAVPYDPSLLPQGFTEDDIQTYVYDRQYNRWIAIQRDSVNEAELLVCSRFGPWEKGLPHTQNDLANPQDALMQVQDMMSFPAQGEGGGDSPLDFINAVLKTPEMPETSAYTPTSIKELKAADPLEGLTLMQPPTANNSGTANLSYPIEVPAGRQGMQPNLALTYSSGGGNGWLGVGWDISIPSITVETRWGVPRYNTNWESEVYVYEGEQLVTKDANGNYRPMAHRTNDTLSISRLSGNVRFHPRRDEAFDSIVRHGSGPDNYWWSVTHRNGVTDYYGKTHGSESVNYSSVLCDPDKHNIAQWMLTESVDANGNWVRYYYTVERCSNISNPPLNKGVEVYCDSITYTGHGNQNTQYSILFHRGDRTDVSTNARYGFREVNTSRLCHLDILFYRDVVRRYFFVLENNRNSNFKSRLTDLVRTDSDEDLALSVLTECDSILSRVVSGKSFFQRTHFDYFDYPDANDLYSEPVTNILPNDGIQSSFRRNNVSATALGATRSSSFNAGGTFSVGVQNNDYVITDFNVGGNFAYGRSESEGALTMIDVNGDGLADKVFKDGYNLYYRPMQMNETDDTQFTFGEKKLVRGANNFLNEVSSSPSFGVQGSVPAMAVSAGMPSTVSSTSTYFSDVNGDGLPDIVTENGVLFNSLDSAGHPQYISANTMRMDPVTETVNTNQVVMTSATAPCGGIIFDGEIDTSIICSQVYPINSFNTISNPSQLEDYLHSDYTFVGSNDSICYYYQNNDEPEIECNLNPSEPDLDAVKVWVAPYNGTVKIHSAIAMIPDYSESFIQSRNVNGIGYSVEWNSVCTVDNSFIIHATDTSTLFKGDLAPKDTVTTLDSTEINVNKDDILFFRLMSKSDHSFDRVDWKQAITYTYISNDDLELRPVIKYNSSEDFILTGQSFFQAPKSGRVILSGNFSGNPGNQTASLHIYKNESSVLNRTILSNQNGDIPFDTAFAVSGGDSILFNISGNGNSNVDWGTLECRPYLKFIEDPLDLSISIPDTLRCYPPVRLSIAYNGTSTTFNKLRKFFGPLYHGWGQFAYNNNQLGSNGLPIDVSTLILPSVYTEPHSALDSATLCGALDTSQFHIDAANHTTDISVESLSSAIDNIFNPLTENSRWVEMTPDNERMVWMGFGQTTSIGKTTMSNTRPTFLIPALNEEDTFPSNMNGTYEIPTYDSPIPNCSEGVPVQTIRKRNISVLGDGSLSLIATDYDDPSNSGSLSMGISISKGENYIESDYIDLNGDRYPDILCKNNVQYSMPWGGLGAAQNLNTTDAKLCKSETSSTGGTFSASYPMPKRMASTNPQKAKISLESLGGSSVDGEDRSCIMYLDVNGDGLPDRFDERMSVSINNGYSFDPYEDWGVNIPRRGSSHSSGSSTGVGFSMEQTSISGGIGHNSSENATEFMLMDFNGDGLPDKVQKSSSGLTVCYNLGNRQWSSPESISTISHIGLSHSFSESANGSLTLGFPVGEFAKIQAGVQLSPYNCSFSYDDAQLTDINGDGYPDYVTSQSEASMIVSYNTAGKTNLLHKVTNFTGSTIELDYDMPVSCYEKPQRSWNLAEVKVSNNDTLCPVGGNQMLTRFTYENPHYDRYERMDYGYGKITSFQYDTQGGDTLYRYTVEEFNNHNFAKRGRKTRDCLYDAFGRAFVEHLYDATVFDFAGSEVSDDNCARTDVFVGVESDLTNYYEGMASAQITTRIVRKYDSHRNVTEFIYYGDTTHHEEWFKANMSYRTSPGYNLISLTDTIIVRNFLGDTLQKRTACYFQNGKLQTLKRHNGPIAACLDFTYDIYGNLSTAMFPSNQIGQRLEFRYDYDSVVHIYPIQVINVSLNYHATSSYDYWYGKPTKTKDVNGNEIWYEYDMLGRTVKITAPYEQNNVDPYTIKMFYTPHNYRQIDIFHNNSNPYSYAITEHYDCQHPGNPIRTTLITDGLGRLLQTKKDAEIGGQEVSLVTGKVEYDCFGRTLKQYHPFTEPLGNEPVYNGSVIVGTATVTEYDLMDRQMTVTVPGNFTTSFNYGFGTHNGNRYFSITTTDALSNSVTVLKGSLGEQIKIDAPMNATTTFSYDALGQLITSTDPDGMSTSYAYDQFGQLIRRTHPDAGDDIYGYDLSGNLIFHVNGNRDSTKYQYNFNQLTDIIYPNSPANNVHYKYGDSGAAYNRAGRIMFQEDASGWQVFSYGKLGEVTENIRTFALPFESKPYTFKMCFEYDSWNRMQRMTYPDGEKVSYGYNLGGMLDSIYGQKDGFYYPYVNHINYNQFEQKDSVLYGNGSVVTYQYDTLMRLKHLRSYTGTTPAELMQDITYQYDSVSNILQIKNQAQMLSNGLGGAYVSNYTYDHLYRLSAANGNWDNGTLYNTFSVNMGYNLNGRIYKKNIQADILDYHGNVTTKRYQNTYSYNSTHNTLQMVDDAISGQRQYFSWDHNGNMIEQMDREDCIRKLCWSEENRLMGVADCNYASIYQYDASGERTYKLTGQYRYQNINGHYYPYAVLENPTLYASPYVVCTPKGYTKHYYAESERVASKIGNGCLRDLCTAVNTTADFNEKDILDNQYLIDCVNDNDSLKVKLERNYMYGKKVMECTDAGNFYVKNKLEKLYQFIECMGKVEKECYWYHPDHLGSSSWITFTDGKAVQHLHYLPWGEDFVDQRSTSWSARYAFSAKERDTETGLSYFGARYYSSDLSVWLSVDPMSDKYPSLSPYVYCADNPVKLTDPDGRWIPGLDEDNNIIVTQEEGDDLNSFREFMGAAYSDDEIQNMYGQMQDGTINLTKTYGNEFQIMTNALNDAKKDPFFTQNQNYNCWGASLALMRGEELYGNGPDPFFPWCRDGVGLNSPTLFDFALNNYVPVKQEEASVGKTIMRYGVPVFGATTHASIFLGVDNSGNEYTFSKDGWNARPVVYNSRLLGYGMVMGRAPYESGYYVKK